MSTSQGSRSGNLPDSPECRRVAEWVAVDKEEVGRPAFLDDAGSWFAQHLPPLHVTAARASRGSSPHSTRASTSHAIWLARAEPPPKSVPAAMRTPALWGQADTLAGDLGALHHALAPVG
jgi:hypothetical protein